MALFPIFYAGNIGYYRALLNADTVVFEQYEHFPKQTFRNRMEILGPNGLQKLVIPTVKTGERRTMQSVDIHYGEQWPKDHWKSLEAAYRRSPYFEFYEEEFHPFFTTETKSLMAFNLAIHKKICALLSLDIPFELTSSYENKVASDRRDEDFKSNLPNEPYMQVFADRHPFHADLSILDALFNLGPQTIELISQS